MAKTIPLTGAVGLADARTVLESPVRLALSPKAARAVDRSRAFVEKALKAPRPVYGLNTGFGRLAQVRIPADQVGLLQENLLRSHAAGVGDPLPLDATRLLFYIKLQALAQGFPGVSRPVLEFFIRLFNAGAIPVIPSQGSVGASGDLAPLAHLALPILGEGEVWLDGKRRPARRALEKIGLKPVPLAAKEGLSLINGTQGTAAVALAALIEARELLVLADVAGAMSLEALKGTPEAFREELVRLKRHPGPLAGAANLRRLMAGSAIRDSHKDCPRVQDAYSLRCMPQVHGAARDALAHVEEMLLREANACSDNPAVLPDGSLAMGGNFHAMPAAFAADYLALALCSLATMSERRTERLVNPDLSGLPPFLVQNSGLHSGFMMMHVTAAALASENKTLAHPASADTIPTSAAQEDHVSMGMAAAVKALRVVANVRRILAVELIAGAQGMEFHRPLSAGRGTGAMLRWIRRRARFLDADRVLSRDMERVAADLRWGDWRASVERAAGPLV